MNRSLFVCLLLCPTLALAAVVGRQNDVTLIIRGNGTGLSRADSTQPRKMLEQQLKLWETYAKRSAQAPDGESEDETDNAPPEAPPPPTADKTAPLSKDELTKRLKEMMNSRLLNQMYGGGSNVLETVDVTDDTVRTVITTEFASLETLVGGAMMRLAETGFNRVRLEQTTNSTLRLTLSHIGPAGQMYKSMLQMWRLTGYHGQLRIEFPGKVLTSSLPHTEGNATWLVIDPRDTNVVAQLEKLHSADAVIEAEAGGVKVAKTLDSMRLQMWQGRSPEPDLPLTESQGGFVAEAKSAVQTEVYYFPGGKEALADQEQWSGERPGLQIQAQLFPPRGRSIRVITDVTVVKAVDDKGRNLPQAEATAPEQQMIRFTGSPNENSPGASVTIQVPTPPADTKAIEELTAEAIVTTNEGWKELTIAKLETGTNTTTTLTNVLAGATLRVKHVKHEQRNGELELEVTGPADVRQLDFQVPPTADMQISSSAYDSNVRTENGKTVRTVHVSFYAYPKHGGGDEEGEGAVATGGGNVAPSLRVRYPEKLRREKVTFKLEAIDLL